MTYSWKEYIRNDFNAVEKYYSPTMAKKYENHERRSGSDIPLASVERVRYCSACGKQINVYDGDILEADGKQVLCLDCLKKAMEKK